MATRAKKKVLTDISKEDAENAFAEYAKAESKSEELTAKMEQRITKIREEYSDDLATLAESKRENVDILEVYAKENKELFTSKKSFEMAHGTIGYRTGTHKLSKLKGFTWDDVLEMVKKKLPDFVRTKDELNKEGIIAARDTDEVTKALPKIGCEIVQDETFYVQPKKEATLN